MTVKGGTTPACAACKYQRRKCSQTCPLAPYFPASQPKIFQNVHRLFGVSNITKTLNSLRTKDQQDDAMKSIISEAEMRARFPVYGCLVIISQLRLQLEYALNELRSAFAHLASFREVAAASSDQYNQFLSNENTSVDSYPDIQVQMDSLSIVHQQRNMHFPDFDLETKESFVPSAENSSINAALDHRNQNSERVSGDKTTDI